MPQQFIGQSSSSLNNNINTAVILAAGRGERIVVLGLMFMNVNFAAAAE